MRTVKTLVLVVSFLMVLGWAVQGTVALAKKGGGSSGRDEGASNSGSSGSSGSGSGSSKSGDGEVSSALSGSSGSSNSSGSSGSSKSLRREDATGRRGRVVIRDDDRL